MPVHTAYLLLGANLGNCIQTFKEARKQLSRQAGVITKASHLYTSPAWGFEAKEVFYNQALELETALDPYALLQKVLEIETALGRVRPGRAEAAAESPEGTGQDGSRNLGQAPMKPSYASRTIDIDILFYSDFIIRGGCLSLPHPLMQERAFVLVPLAEIAPRFLHPVLGSEVQVLLRQCPDSVENVRLCRLPVPETFSDVENAGQAKNEAGEIRLEEVGGEAEERQASFWPEKLRFLAIEGNIGAGKTSLARKIAARFGAKLVVEIFEDNVFLPKFYADRERFAFPLELTFLAERYRQAKEDFVQELFSPFLVSDFSISKSLVFARNTLQQDEYLLFKRLYDIILTSIPKPDIYVYIHSGVERLMRNIRQRGRSYEANMDPAYLATVEEGYRSYMQTLDPARCLFIDVDGMDFVRSEADFEAILQRILQAALQLP